MTELETSFRETRCQGGGSSLLGGESGFLSAAETSPLGMWQMCCCFIDDSSSLVPIHNCRLWKCLAVSVLLLGKKKRMCPLVWARVLRERRIILEHDIGVAPRR